MAEPPCIFCEPSDSSQVVDTAWIDGATLPPAYGQLLGLGLIMILAHCSGMCGPLILSFRFGLQQAGRAGRLGSAALQLGAYQAGRGLLYALFGALAGGLAGVLGNGFARSLAGGLHLVGPVIALAFLVLALRRVWPRSAATTPASRPGPVALLGRRWQERLGNRPVLRAFGLGLLLAFLPCMVTAWVLLLAASTGSGLHGAVLMLLLVAMTTPALLPFAIAPGQLPRLRARWGHRLQTAALFFSAAWMGLISLAANGLIAHRGFAIAGIEVMLF